MSTDPTPSTHLHLPSLSIQGFRGIQQLDISRLGRVTLFAGKNGVGKTTILEAIRVYAARGSYHIFTDLLDAREELIESVNGEGDKSPAPDWKSLFFGWPISPDAGIAIGSPVDGDFLTIELSTLSRQETEGLPRQRAMFRLLSDDETNEPCLRIDYNDMSRMIPISYSDMYSRRAYPSRYSLRMYQKDDKGFASEVLCESLGPGLMSNNDMARFWDNIALTDNETSSGECLAANLRKSRRASRGDWRRPEQPPTSARSCKDYGSRPSHSPEEPGRRSLAYLWGCLGACQ